MKCTYGNRYLRSAFLALLLSFGHQALAQVGNEHDIIRATATSDDGNVPNNAIDGLLTTRWSASGLGQSLSLDLGAIRDIGSVSIAFYKGNERRTKFDLSLSTDGVTYAKYGTTLTSALSLAAQNFKLVGRARFVRITGYGNDSTATGTMNWNSLSEVYVYAPVATPTPTPAPTPATGPAPVLTETFDYATQSAFGTAVVNHKNALLAPGKGVNGSTAIKVNYVGNSEGSERVLVGHRLPQRALQYTLNFDVQFCPGFDWAKGGKLHGLGPDAPVAGGNEVSAARWSARAMWRGDAGIQSYVYSQNMPGQYGDVRINRDFKFSSGRYYAMTYQVSLNTSATATDGFMRLYVDGNLIINHTGIRYRGTTSQDSMISTLMFNTFFGGHDSTWAPRNADGSYKTDCAYFDNFAAYPALRVRTQLGK